MAEVASKPRAGPGSLPALLVFLAACAVVAGLGGAATASGLPTWYAGLHKPSFNPPNWVFGPVWTALYLMMALAAWRVWRRGGEGRRGAIALWAAQLAANLAWSFIFFGWRSPGPALIDIAVLCALIVATLAAFWRVDRPAAWLLVPYLAWCSFAAALNYEIWRLN